MLTTGPATPACAENSAWHEPRNGWLARSPHPPSGAYACERTMTVRDLPVPFCVQLVTTLNVNAVAVALALVTYTRVVNRMPGIAGSDDTDLLVPLAPESGTLWLPAKSL